MVTQLLTLSLWLSSGLLLRMTSCMYLCILSMILITFHFKCSSIQVPRSRGGVEVCFKCQESRSQFTHGKAEEKHSAKFFFFFFTSASILWLLYCRSTFCIRKHEKASLFYIMSLWLKPQKYKQSRNESRIKTTTVQIIDDDKWLKHCFLTFIF